MMRLSTRWSLIAAAVAVVVTATPASTALAQPLVGGDDLIFYFPFEDGDFAPVADEPFVDGIGTFIGVLSDRSDNGFDFDGDVYTPDPDFASGEFAFEIDTTNSQRGGGSAKFVQSDFPDVDGAVYVNLRGEDLFANFPEKTVAATNSATYAAWINTTTNSVTDQAIFQGRGNGPDGGSGHGGPHFQIQSNGKLRTTMRDSEGSNTVNAPQVFINGDPTTGDPFPVDTWFHYASTYDSDTNTWAMYYNGVLIQSGSGEGTGLLGNWAGKSTVSDPVGTDPFSLGFGAVYDNLASRNFEGNLDELYVFKRALSATEIATLALLATPGLPGDGNGDGWVDGLDYLLWAANFGDDPADDPPGSPGNGDYDDNGVVNGLDYLVWAAAFGTHSESTSVPEPGSLALACLALASLFVTGRRRS